MPIVFDLHLVSLMYVVPCSTMQREEKPIRGQWDEANDDEQLPRLIATRDVDDVMLLGHGVAWHLTNHHYHPRPFPPRHHHHQQQRRHWVVRGVGGEYIPTHKFHNLIHVWLRGDGSGISIVRHRGSVRRPLIRYICMVRGVGCRRRGGIV